MSHLGVTFIACCYTPCSNTFLKGILLFCRSFRQALKPTLSWLLCPQQKRIRPCFSPSSLCPTCTSLSGGGAHGNNAEEGVAAVLEAGFPLQVLPSRVTAVAAGFTCHPCFILDHPAQVGGRQGAAVAHVRSRGGGLGWSRGGHHASPGPPEPPQPARAARRPLPPPLMALRPGGGQGRAAPARRDAVRDGARERSRARWPNPGGTERASE